MIESLVQSAMRGYKKDSKDVTIIKPSKQDQIVEGIIVTIDNTKFYGKISLSDGLIVMYNPCSVEDDGSLKPVKIKVNGTESTTSQLIFGDGGVKYIHLINSIAPSAPEVAKDPEVSTNQSNPPGEKSFEVLNGAPNALAVSQSAKTSKTYDIISH